MAGRMLTLKEVAARLDIWPPVALKLVERGTLAAERVGRQRLVDTDDLESVPPIVAWMDLADEDDRAARLVLEYVLRRQPA